MEEEEAFPTAELRVPNTVPDLLSNLVEGPKAVATSSSMASNPGASDLFSHNELLRVTLSKRNALYKLERASCTAILEEFMLNLRNLEAQPTTPDPNY